MNKVAERGKKFNLLFNVFLVAGMVLAVAVTTFFKIRQPGVKAFMLILAGFGSVMGVVNTVMSANGNILTFVFGFLDVLIGTIVYFENGVLGTFALHAFYFLPMQFVGYVQWRKRGAKLGSSEEGPVRVGARRLSGRQWACLAGGVVISVVALYFILLGFDNAKAAAGKICTVNRSKVLFDALVMTLNIAGQVLLSFAYTEQWYLWILVNLSSIGLWTVALLQEGGSATASVMLVKYVFYLMNSINGLRIWTGLGRDAGAEDLHI